MPGFDYRLSFKLPQGDHINFDGEELELVRTDVTRVRLRSGARGTPVKAHSQGAILGGPYTSRDEAVAAAARAREALLVWAVKYRTGIDLGDGRSRGVLTDYGRKMLEKQMGAPVRNAMHGTDVYEAEDGLVFVSLNAQAAVGRNADAFRSDVVSLIAKPLGLSEKQLLAAELYCASYFDLSFRSRFITLVTVLEALLQPEPRPEVVQEFLGDCQARLDVLEVTPDVKTSIRSGLEWLKSESISHSGRFLCERLLVDRKCKGMRAARFFTYCYGIRSEIVHNGKHSDPTVDLLDLANTSQRFVGDLLIASFGLPFA